MDIFLDEDDFHFFIYKLRQNLFPDKKHSRRIILLPANSFSLISYCLMPNHYHFLLRQKEDYGISKFMNKIGVGYANYFNLKYERVGSLFQGTFKAVSVEKESQFLYIPYYIHLNPLDLINHNWRENGVKEINKALDFLESYKWSSHRDYLGKPIFTGVVNKKYLNEIFINSKIYRNEFKKFIEDFDFSDISQFLLEY